MLEKRARYIQLKFRVDKREYDAIMKRQKEYGLKDFGVFVRQMLVDGQVRVIDYSVLKNVRLEINRIGVNVNQIAKQVNEQDEATQDQVFACVSQLDELKIILENLIEQEVKREEKE